MTVYPSTSVTISDCGKALEAIEKEIQELSRRKTEIERKIEALLTQGRMIHELVRRIA